MFVLKGRFLKRIVSETGTFWAMATCSSNMLTIMLFELLDMNLPWL